MRPYVEIDAPAFAARCSGGATRLAVASDTFAPVPVRSLTDLQALDAFYLGGTGPAGPSAALAAALGSMYRNGYCFKTGDGRLGRLFSREVGPYGAFVALEAGKGVTAARYGEPAAPLRTDEDAERVEFFRVGEVRSPALAHVGPAQTLLELEKKQGAAFFVGEKAVDAEQAWRALYGRNPALKVEAGIDGVPLIALSAADCEDGAASTSRLATAVAEFRQLMNLGLPAERGREAWTRVAASRAGEPFADRLAAVDRLLSLCGRNPSQALDAYDSVATSLRPGDRLLDQVAAYAAVRGVLDSGHHREAATAFLTIRDRIDQALPGPEPADEKRRLYLRLLEGLQRPDRVEAVWSRLDSGDPRAVQVDVFASLQKLEHGSSGLAEADFEALVRGRRAGEKLTDLYPDFAYLRPFGADADSSSTVEAFHLLRTGLAASAPGPISDARRIALFKQLVASAKSCSTAVRIWRQLGTAGPGNELEARLAGWARLVSAEDGHASAASRDLATVMALRLPGERLDAAVAAFLDVRVRLGRHDSAAANDAFRFIRGPLDRTLDGSWSVAQKRDMYLELLGALHDHKRALHDWKMLRHGDPSEFPLRLNAFVSLLGFEGDESEARKTFEVVVHERRAGEPLSDLFQGFADVRSRLPRQAGDQARAAFRFVRRDLARTLPGAWTDEQRAAMYLRVLDASKSQVDASRAWAALVGGRGHKHATPDFPLRLDAFMALHAFEGDVPSALGALDAVDEIMAREPGARRDDLVKEYLGLRALTRNSATEGVILLHRVHGQLEPAEIAPYLKLQQTTRSLYTTEEAWRLARSCKLPLAGAVDVLAESLTRTRSVAVAGEDLAAVAENLRPGETVPRAAAALDQVRQALPPTAVGEAATVFGYLRRNVAPSEEALFLAMVKQARSGITAVTTWMALRQGDKRTLALRAGLVVRQAPTAWPAMVDRMNKVDRTIPRGVDHDRAMSALLFVAALPDPAAIRRVLARLEEMPGTDRTAGLEWLCGIMTAAGDAEGFEQAYGDVHRPGAPGSPAGRQEVLSGLLEATRGSEDGFDASLDFLHRLDGVPPADFDSTAASATALAAVMRGKAGDAERAFEYILDARAQGAYASETLDATLTRFATFYASSHSVESGLEKLDQAPGGGTGTIERQDDGDVIIGGIRVPRARKPETRPSAFYGWFYEQLKKRHRI
jgi:hypothetical protein